MRVRSILAVLFLCCTAVAAQESTPVSREVELGRDFTDKFYRGELSAIYAHFSSGLKEEMSIEHFRAIRANMDRQLGLEQEFVDERVELVGDYRVYVRKARFAKSDEHVLVTWWLKADGSVGAFRIRPATVTPVEPVEPGDPAGPTAESKSGTPSG